MAPPPVSSEAGALIRESDCIDLHVESFLWTRIFGYDLISVSFGEGRLSHRLAADRRRLIAL